MSVRNTNCKDFLCSHEKGRKQLVNVSQMVKLLASLRRGPPIQMAHYFNIWIFILLKHLFFFLLVLFSIINSLTLNNSVIWGKCVRCKEHHLAKARICIIILGSDVQWVDLNLIKNTKCKQVLRDMTLSRKGQLSLYRSWIIQQMKKCTEWNKQIFLSRALHQLMLQCFLHAP